MCCIARLLLTFLHFISSCCLERREINRSIISDNVATTGGSNDEAAVVNSNVTTVSVRTNDVTSESDRTNDVTNESDQTIHVEADTELTAFERSLMLSKEQTDLAVEIQMYIYYVAVVVVIPPIIFNITVFLRRSMRSSTGDYVIGLSFAQLLYVVVVISVQILRASLDDYTTSQVYWVFYVYCAVYGGIAAKRCGYLIMCLVSVERLYAVVRPLHAKTFLLSKHSVSVLCFAFFYPFSGTSTFPAEPLSFKLEPGRTGERIYRAFRTELYKNTAEINDAFSLGAKIVLSFSTLLVQLLLNALTIWALRRHNMAAKQVQSSADETVRRQRERQMTVTILASTIAYVALSIPSAVHNLFYTLFPEDYVSSGKYSNLYAVTGALIRNLTIFGAGVDFVCFLSLSSAYRREFFQLFACQARNRLGEIVKDNQTETEGFDP